MWFYIIFQPEVPLFGPHDTSRVSESDPPQISADGKLHARVCALHRSNDSRFQPIRLCIDASINLFFSDLPVKQGMLFSEDEDVDVQKESGLVASAKITLFEVEINI